MRCLRSLLTVFVVTLAIGVSSQAIALTQFRITDLGGTVLFDETVTDENFHNFTYTGGGIFSGSSAEFDLLGEGGVTSLSLSGAYVNLNPGDSALGPIAFVGTTLTDITSIVASHPNINSVTARLFYARMVSEVSAAPEPISILFLATGMGALIVVRRRRLSGRVVA